MNKPGTFTPNQPMLKWHDDDRQMVLAEDFCYTTLGGVTHTAPRGMITDGKTVPRLLWWTKIAGSPFTGPSRRPAIIHDKLCQQANMLNAHDRESLRRYADTLFREMIARAITEYYTNNDESLTWIRRAWRRIKSGAMRLGVRIGSLWSRAFNRK